LSTASPPPLPSPPVTTLLAGYTREAVLPSLSVGHSWGVTRKICSGPVRRRRRKLRSAPSLICLSISEKQLGVTLHRWIYSGELLLFGATRSLIWRGPLGYIPWRKRFSKTFAFHLLPPNQGNLRPNPNPNS
jgi:hypothetical protein